MANQYDDKQESQQERSVPNKGQFDKSDPQRAANAGRKGGQASKGRRSE